VSWLPRKFLERGFAPFKRVHADGAPLIVELALPALGLDQAQGDCGAAAADLPHNPRFGQGRPAQE
jgi:hypothetical protein